MKINFTKEHYSKMCELAIKMLLSNETVTTNMGQTLNIVELIHTPSINSLNKIKNNLGKSIQNLEERDEWVEVNTAQLDGLKEKKELINLIIGFRRYSDEIKENLRKKRELMEKRNELIESIKTPDDRIKEIDAEIAAIDIVEDFK